MVKICGLRVPGDAAACREAGATLAGLNFVTRSRRAIRAPEARQVKKHLGPCAPVLLYRDDALDTILVETEALGVRRVQLHGDESPDDCARLRDSSLWVLKALRFDGRREALEREARRFVGAVDALLIDAPTPGAGRPFAWGDLAGLGLPRPFFLAGGLTPENVARAVELAGPDGVDVASGVEREGRLCPDKITAFVQEARRALAALASEGTP